MRRHSSTAKRQVRRHRASCVALWFCLTLLPGALQTAWGQGNTAVVTGADRVFVRRGPGTEFPPFATLTDGSTVEVLEMQGEWSRVKTANGQVGYMHSNFLALPSEAGAAARRAPTEARPQPTAVPTPHPTPHTDTAALTAATERNKALEAQVSALQDELTALKNRPTPVPEVVPTPVAGNAETDELRAELKRLTAAVEGLQQRGGGGAPGEAVPTESPEHGVASTALLLGGVGLLIGWLLGAAYGRNQERGRRSRIRF